MVACYMITCARITRGVVMCMLSCVHGWSNPFIENALRDVSITALLGCLRPGNTWISGYPGVSADCSELATLIPTSALRIML